MTTKIEIGKFGDWTFTALLYNDHSVSIWREGSSWNIRLVDIVPELDASRWHWSNYLYGQKLKGPHYLYGQELKDYHTLYLQAKERLEKILVLL